MNNTDPKKNWARMNSWKTDNIDKQVKNKLKIWATRTPYKNARATDSIGGHVKNNKVINNIQTTNLSNKEAKHRLQIEHNNRSFLMIHYYGHECKSNAFGQWGAWISTGDIDFLFFSYILPSSNCVIKTTVVPDVCIIYWNTKHHQYSVALQTDLSHLAD
jgi:hypothetical protein